MIDGAKVREALRWLRALDQPGRPLGLRRLMEARYSKLAREGKLAPKPRQLDVHALINLLHGHR